MGKVFLSRIKTLLLVIVIEIEKKEEELENPIKNKSKTHKTRLYLISNSKEKTEKKENTDER